MDDEYDVRSSNLGDDFNEGVPGVTPLCNTEVEVILSRVREEQTLRAQKPKKAQTASEQYLSKLRLFDSAGDVQRIRSMFTNASTEFTNFEVASLCNLLPEDLHEARTYLPSLISTPERPVDDQELQTILTFARHNSHLRPPQPQPSDGDGDGDGDGNGASASGA